MYSIIKDGGVCSPQGFLASGIKAGIKASGNADMALLKSERAARCFAVFTTNKVKAAPVLYDKDVFTRIVVTRIAIKDPGTLFVSFGQ
jgi:glutamate N-acetyltransferase/amino-acid N-acetyltransferase